MPDDNIAVAVYESHVGAGQAVEEFQSFASDMKKLSISGKNSPVEGHVVGFYNAGDRIQAWSGACAGAVPLWGGMWGLLLGAAFFLVPGIRLVLTSGPLAAWIVGALESAAVLGGIGAICAGLFRIGPPTDSVLKCEVSIKTIAEAASPREIMEGTK